MNKNSSIYIAGHRGFVGSNLYNRLVREEYTNVKTSSKKIDLRDPEQVEWCFEIYKPDYVFICAAIVGGIGAQDNYRFLLENLQIQNNLIESCIKYNVKKVLSFGSSCIYPKDYIQPLKEEYLLKNIPEPSNEGYSLSKICGLKLCEYANKKFGNRFISLMPCNLFGSGDHFDLHRSHVLGSLINKIYTAKKNNIPTVEVWGSGKARREFMYIDDLIDGILWAMDNEYYDGFFNIGTGIDHSIKELAEIIVKVVDFSGDLCYNTSKPEGMMKKCLDVSKINSLGWKAKTTVEEGIEKTVKWFGENYDQISK